MIQVALHVVLSNVDGERWYTKKLQESFLQVCGAIGRLPRETFVGHNTTNLTLAKEADGQALQDDIADVLAHGTRA